jgi:hypothetical protein
MTQWDELRFEERLRTILTETRPYVEGHHFGNPFLTSYQLAIEFQRRYPDDVARMNLTIGGAGTGRHVSLAQYIARELSRRIRTGQLTDIQGAFLADRHLSELSFLRGEDQVSSSGIGNWDAAMFRHAPASRP